MQVEKEKQIKKLCHLEFFRILFTITILYGHIIQWFMIPQFGKEIFFIHLMKHISYSFGYMCDMFFVLSGFFMFFSFEKKNQTFIKFIEKKIARLSPILIFTIFLFFLLHKINLYRFDNYSNFCAIFFLSGFSPSIQSCNGVSWYINVMFFGYIFYYCICNIFDKEKLNYIIGIITLVSYSILLNKLHLYNSPLWNGVFSFFMIRAIAGMGIGYIFANFYINSRINIKENNRKSFYVWSFCEIFLLCLIMKAAIIKSINVDFPLMMICFLIVFYSFLFKKGIISSFFDKKILSILGKYCYSTYMVQWVIFICLNKWLWFNPIYGVKVYPVLNIVLGICACIVAGVLLYHTVERPCKKIILKQLNLNDSF